MSQRLAALRLPALRRLLLAYFVGRSGDWFGEMALSIVVLRASGSVLAVASFWMVSAFLPAFLAPALAGRLRVRPASGVLIAARSVEAGLFAGIAVCAALGVPYPVMLALALVDGVLNIVASGLAKAAIVCVARPAGLHEEANALVNLAFTISFAGGPALAGLLIAGVGPPVALALDAASFLLAAIAVAGIGSLEAPAPESSPTLETATHPPCGVRALYRRRSLRSLLFADGLSTVVFALIIPVELVFVTQTLGAGTGAFGLVLAAWGVGAVVGAGALMRLARADGRMLVAASFLVMIVGYLGMGMADSVAAVVGFSFLGGIGNGLEGGALLTLVQQQVADREQSALNCLLESLHTGGPGAGYVLGAVIAATASPRTTYLVAAAGGLVALSALIRIAPRVTRPSAAPAPATL